MLSSSRVSIAASPGADTLYVADESFGVAKYSLVAGSWVANGTVGAGADAYRGITGTTSGTTVTLFATRKGGSTATGGGELVAIVDASGYNGAFAGRADAPRGGGRQHGLPRRGDGAAEPPAAHVHGDAERGSERHHHARSRAGRSPGGTARASR